MAKNRNRGGASRNAADGGNNNNKPAHTVMATTSTATTAKEALLTALQGLDAVAQESHQYQVAERNSAAAAAAAAAAVVPGTKRQRNEASADEEQSAAAPAAVGKKSEVFAAMASVHYRTLSAAVAAFGLQLLPSLDDMVRRVGLAVGTPSLASVECWECAAMLCTYYHAGAVRLLNELTEVLLREPGVFMLDAACLVPAALMASAAAPSNASPVEDSSEVAVHYRRVSRKLKAFQQMLNATGPYLPAATLQQVALRFSMEVVEQGILEVRPSAQQGGNDVLVADAEPAQQLMRWRVPVAWQSDCIDIVRTLILVCRPLPSEVSVCAMRVVQDVTSSLHRGALVQMEDSEADDTNNNNNINGSNNAMLPSFTARRGVLASTVELQLVLHLLRHPCATAQYAVPQLVVERPKRKVFVAAPPAEVEAEETVPAVAAEEEAVPMAASSSIQLVSAVPVPAVVPQPATTVAAAPPPPQWKAPAAAAAPVARVSAPPLEPVSATITPATRGGPAAVDAEEDEEDEIPDIDMED